MFLKSSGFQNVFPEAVKFPGIAPGDEWTVFQVLHPHFKKSTFDFCYCLFLYKFRLQLDFIWWIKRVLQPKKKFLTTTFLFVKKVVNPYEGIILNYLYFMSITS